MATPLEIVRDRTIGILMSREQNFDDPRPMFDAIAAIWSAYLGIPIDHYDVAVMLNLFKIQRNKYGGFKEDHGDDEINYLTLGMVMKELDKNDTTN